MLRNLILTRSMLRYGVNIRSVSSVATSTIPLFTTPSLLIAKYNLQHRSKDNLLRNGLGYLLHRRLLHVSLVENNNYQDEINNRYQTLHRFQKYYNNKNGNFNNGNNDYKYNQRDGINSIWGVTLIGIGTMTCIFFTTNIIFQYVPPFSYFKDKPRQLVYTIIGCNLIIFTMWQIPKFYPFLAKYMLLQKISSRQISNPWSVIGSAFSHQESWHLGMNMLALWSFGTSLATMLGPSTFFNLYLNSAIMGSIFSLWYPTIFQLARSSASLGASSALFGVFGCFAYLIPNANIMLFVFPIPGGAWVAFLGSIIWNGAGCILKWGSFDYAAHLGGSLIGVLYGYLIKKRAEERRDRLMRGRRKSSSSTRWF